MVQFKIVSTLAELSPYAGKEKFLRLVEWNGYPARLDLRYWVSDEIPGKGVTLTDEEAQTLADAIIGYLRDKYGDGGISEPQ